jgi:bifunctional DNA-binding transcriptional regulator/antitoxin component of YhaV-PrlF toxin-antitoxin module
MKEIISTITNGGQVTIPVEIRRYLGVTTNDKIAFVIDPEGVVRLTVPRYPSVAALRGAVGKLDKQLSWKQMQQIAHEDWLEGMHEAS